MLSELSEEDELYKNYIKDKKVLFVGPAPTLIGEGFGNKYDNDYDIVIRSNGAIFLLGCEKYKDDYGSRCDVLYSNVQFAREMKPFPLREWNKAYSLKFLNMKTGGIASQHGIIIRKLSALIGELHKIIEGILMGPIIITDIIRQHPASLFVTGMNFYINKPRVFIPGDYREYVKGYLPYKITTKADIVNRGKIDPHNMKSNTSYLYNLWKAGKIEVDNYMQELMPKIVEDTNETH